MSNKTRKICLTLQAKYEDGRENIKRSIAER